MLAGLRWRFARFLLNWALSVDAIQVAFMFADTMTDNEKLADYLLDAAFAQFLDEEEFDDDPLDDPPVSLAVH